MPSTLIHTNEEDNMHLRSNIKITRRKSLVKLEEANVSEKKYTRSDGKEKRRASVGLDSDDIISSQTTNPISTFERKESLGSIAIRSFNYNDPELVFQLSPTGPIVMGGTKEKLISLLTEISIIGKSI